MGETPVEQARGGKPWGRSLSLLEIQVQAWDGSVGKVPSHKPEAPSSDPQGMTVIPVLDKQETSPGACWLARLSSGLMRGPISIWRVTEGDT